MKIIQKWLSKYGGVLVRLGLLLSPVVGVAKVEQLHIFDYNNERIDWLTGENSALANIGKQEDESKENNQVVLAGNGLMS